MQNEKNKFLDWKRHHIWLRSIFWMLLCWSPYFLKYFPGIMSPDSYGQFKQAIGAAAYSNHHPIVHTLLIRLMVTTGKAVFGSWNAGIACYTVLQMILMAAIFSVLVLFIAENTKSRYAGKLTWAYFALFPLHGMYSVTLYKDVLFGGVVLLFLMLLFIYRKESSISKQKKAGLLVCLFVTGFLFCVLRTNGFYAFLLVTIVFCFLLRKQQRSLLGICILGCVLACIFRGPILGFCNIKNADTVESLSIPIQQITRVYYDGKEVSIQEDEWLQHAVDTEKLAKVYNPHLSDPVKNLYRENPDQTYLQNHLKEFLVVWLKIGLEHPGEYLLAFADQTGGYWNPVVRTSVFAEGIVENEYGLVQKSFFPEPVNFAMQVIVKGYKFLPLNGIVYNNGMVFLFYCFMLIWCMKKKKKEECLYFIPIFALWLTIIIAAPGDAQCRFVYWMYTAIPFMIWRSFGNNNFTGKYENTSIIQFTHK